MNVEDVQAGVPSTCGSGLKCCVVRLGTPTRRSLVVTAIVHVAFECFVQFVAIYSETGSRYCYRRARLLLALHRRDNTSADDGGLE